MHRNPFEVQKTAGAARTGVLHTKHGEIPTPNFMSVATRGVFHGMEIFDALAASVDVIMCNTFHLSNEVGAEKIFAKGGLHAWMKWPKPLATDSGGFQVFSYGWSRLHGVKKMIGGINTAQPSPSGSSDVVIDDDGVTFRLNGRPQRLTPKESIRLQELLGADIIFAFDEPTSPLHDQAYNLAALERTHRWAKTCIDSKTRDDEILLGIVQGGPFQELRQKSATEIASLPFDGFAIGGSYDAGGAAAALNSVGSRLGEDRVRHVLGIGWVKDIIHAVDAGADLFDCVEPIRRARHQSVLVGGIYRDIVPVARERGDQPLDEQCDCQTCQTLTAQKVKAMCRAKDLAGSRALAIHNTRQLVRCMQSIRQAIHSGHWAAWRDEQLQSMLK